MWLAGLTVVHRPSTIRKLSRKNRVRAKKKEHSKRNSRSHLITTREGERGVFGRQLICREEKTTDPPYANVLYTSNLSRNNLNGHTLLWDLISLFLIVYFLVFDCIFPSLAHLSISRCIQHSNVSWPSKDFVSGFIRNLIGNNAKAPRSIWFLVFRSSY